MLGDSIAAILTPKALGSFHVKRVPTTYQRFGTSWPMPHAAAAVTCRSYTLPNATIHRKLQDYKRTNLDHARALQRKPNRAIGAHFQGPQKWIMSLAELRFQQY